MLAGIGETYQPDGRDRDRHGPAQLARSWRWRTGPPFDPTNPGERRRRSELGNMATGFTYEPGSTFKAFTVAGALQDGVVTPDTRPSTWRPTHPGGGPDDRGVARRAATATLTGGRHPRPVLERRRGHDRLSSSSRRLRRTLRHTGSARFGFGQPTGVDVPGRGAGDRVPPDDYSGSTMGNLPIGQGLSVTPMQMAAAYSAIADGGILRTPRLVLVRGRRPGRRGSPGTG